MNTLPSPDQVWAHSACSIRSLSDALGDPSITAIETDVLTGYETQALSRDRDGDATRQRHFRLHESVPVMSHPPERESDLSMETFVHQTTGGGERSLKKHIKLDFKEIEAVKPTMDAIGRLDLNGKAIFLNADVLPGPGMRDRVPKVDGDLFLRTCLIASRCGHLTKEGYKKNIRYAFSLGWNVDFNSTGGYTKEDISDMCSLIARHNLTEISAGVVLAVNARVLAKNCQPFDSFLDGLPLAQLLIWTGAGEPPIPQKEINLIKGHFKRQQTILRVGFDCQVAHQSD